MSTFANAVILQEQPSNLVDYRVQLRRELNRRRYANPYYSLRAFARDLKIAPSRLSEIFNHKQGLSRKAALKITDLLGIIGETREYFLDSVTAQHARSKTDRNSAMLRLDRYNIAI
tara:strand:- start:1838 stop:2185 length:348 start_codon:yes stop_codon:yes gene_type:complete